MKTKRKLQITVDTLMLFILLLQMSYSIAGELIHEILGISQFVLFILHHILSASFSKAIVKGKRSPKKILKAVIDILLTVDILALMFSAVLVSKHVFAFLDISSMSNLGRTVHLLGAYWGFVLMNFHIGFHLDFVLNKAMKTKKNRIVVYSVMAILSITGLILFITEGIFKYLLLINQFVFFDTTGGLPLFLLKYIPIAALFMTVGYVTVNLIKRRKI